MIDELKLFAKLFFMITVLFIVFLYFLSIILQPALFYFTPEGLSTSMRELRSLSIWFFAGTLYIPVESNLGVLLLGLWITFVVSFAVAWKVRKNFHEVIKESVTKPFGQLFRSSLFAMPILNSMALIAVLLIQSLQEAGGIPTGTSPLPGEPFLDLIELSYAAVFEEISFRIFPIGAFMIIYLVVKARKEASHSSTKKTKLFFMAFLLPDKAKEIVNTKTVDKHGLLRGISLGGWGMIAFTTVIFGLAHFAPGVSWEVGKITSSAFSGLIIAICYLAYGAHAAIIMHWFFNVYVDVYGLLAEYYPVVSPFVSAIWLLTIILGIMGWIVMTGLWLSKLNRVNQKERNRQNKSMENLTISPQ